MVKVYIKKKVKDIPKDKKNYSLYYVPLTKSLENWLNDMHIATNHRSYYYLQYYIRQKHYFYKGINNDIINIINIYQVCKLKANIKAKNEPANKFYEIILVKDLEVI